MQALRTCMGSLGSDANAGVIIVLSREPRIFANGSTSCETTPETLANNHRGRWSPMCQCSEYTVSTHAQTISCHLKDSYPLATRHSRESGTRHRVHFFHSIRERKWLTTRHDTVSNPLRTCRDYTKPTKAKLLTALTGPEEKKVQLVHSLAPAITLNHLANKPQQTTSALFRLIPKDSTTAFTTD